MSKPALFTIGHSNLDLATFVRLLKLHEVEAIADVRSKPYSRWMPHFNQDALKSHLAKINIRYVFLGDELGARREEAECYVGPKAKYELIAKTESFKSGLQRVHTGGAKMRIALMCSEKEPLDCHRTVLVCKYLKDDFEIKHLNQSGGFETHEELETRMLETERLAQPDLFQSRSELLEQAYERRGDKIAYCRSHGNSTEDLNP